MNTKLLAQNKITLPGTNTTIEGPVGLKTEFTDLSSVVTAALPYLFAIAGIILFAFIVWGGFDYLTAMGDPKKAEAGKNKITSAVVGFILIFAAFWIYQLVSYLFKLGI